MHSVISLMPDSGSSIRTNTTKASQFVQESSPGQRAFASAEQNLRLRLVRQALSGYQHAERLGYDSDKCAGARWLCRMLLGDFAEAWRESQIIESRGNPDPNRFWNGRPLDGQNVLVRCLHGLGDTLQYVRYLPLLRQRAASLTLEAQPGLKALLVQSGIAGQVITWNEPEPPWDTQIEIVELPRIFETTIDTIPNRVPYLKAPRAALRTSPNKLPVGLLWASGAYNPARCVPLPILSRICGTPGCEFFSFQAGEEGRELASCNAPVHDLDERDGNALITASKLVNMDLLITVDTMLAHLAGALGIPVWVLLPFEADWRWMLNREDSPWYPTMRLFRQPQPADWDSVIERVRHELTAEAAARAA
jgi:hypothetical protein